MIKNSFKQLPDDLRGVAVDLSERLGVNSYAWYFDDALKVASWCKQNEVPIFGGDVIEQLGNGDLSLTYDNWYQNFDSSMTLPEFTVKSVDYAIQKMTFYAQVAPAKVLLFDLGIKKQE